MKKTVFFALALAVFAMSSCGEDEDISPNPNQIDMIKFDADGNSGGGDQDPTGP